MKYRSRKFSYRNKEPNFWPSFVDMMSNIAIVFVFLMILFSSLIYGKYKDVRDTYNKFDNIGKERAELYEKLEEKLKPSLKDDIIFDKSSGKLEIKTQVLFNVDQYNLTPRGEEIAKKVSEAFIELLKNDEYRSKIQAIEVEGHTDNTYKSDYNRFLSTNRAVSFINAMIPNDSQSEEYAKYFKASGMSKFQPKEGNLTNQTEQQKDSNRRIEINIEINNKDIEDAIKTLLNTQ